jgi:hypothetical protein
MLQMRTEAAGVLFRRAAHPPSMKPTHPPSFVITGLVPVIHVGLVDGRDKPGHDG